MKEQKRIEKEAVEIETIIKGLQAEDENLAKSQQTANQLFRDKVEDLNQNKNKARSLEQKIQGYLLDKEKFQLRMEELEREWAALGREAAGLIRLSEPEGVSVVKNSDWAEAERKMMRLRGELAAIGEIDSNLMKETEESEKRFEFLTTQLSDLEKASADLKEMIRDLDRRIHEDFKKAFHTISEEFNNYFRLMFGGGKAKLSLEVKKPPVLMEEADSESPNLLETGVEVSVNLPGKKITSLDMLSGGEKTLVSLAALFALIAVSPPPFLILDEIDAALDEENARRFAGLIQQFRDKTQFVIVTHNRATMEAADVLYGITMGEDGVSKVLSLKLEG